MDGSPLCIRSPFKELNGNFSAFVSTGVKNQGVSPIHVFRRNFEKYSPATELSFTLSDLTTTTPNDKGRRYLQIIYIVLILIVINYFLLCLQKIKSNILLNIFLKHF